MGFGLGGSFSGGSLLGRSLLKIGIHREKFTKGKFLTDIYTNFDFCTVVIATIFFQER